MTRDDPRGPERTRDLPRGRVRDTGRVARARGPAVGRYARVHGARAARALAARGRANRSDALPRLLRHWHGDRRPRRAAERRAHLPPRARRRGLRLGRAHLAGGRLRGAARPRSVRAAAALRRHGPAAAAAVRAARRRRRGRACGAAGPLPHPAGGGGGDRPRARRAGPHARRSALAAARAPRRLVQRREPVRRGLPARLARRGGRRRAAERRRGGCGRRGRGRRSGGRGGRGGRRRRGAECRAARRCGHGARAAAARAGRDPAVARAGADLQLPAGAGAARDRLGPPPLVGPLSRLRRRRRRPALGAPRGGAVPALPRSRADAARTLGRRGIAAGGGAAARRPGAGFGAAARRGARARAARAARLVAGPLQLARGGRGGRGGRGVGGEGEGGGRRRERGGCGGQLTGRAGVRACCLRHSRGQRRRGELPAALAADDSRQRGPSHADPSEPGRRAAPDVRLRLVLCRVWRLLFGADAPACLGAPTVAIGPREVLPGYVPPYLERKKAERKRAAHIAAEQERTRKAKNVLKLATTATGHIVHDRHNMGQHIEAILYEEGLEWNVEGALPPFVKAIRKKVDDYERRAESKITFDNDLVEAALQAVPALPEGAPLGEGPPRAASPPPQQGLVIKLKI